jgi:hypothetical protein
LLVEECLRLAQTDSRWRELTKARWIVAKVHNR